MGRRSSRHVSPSFVNTHTHTHTHTHKGRIIKRAETISPSTLHLKSRRRPLLLYWRVRVCVCVLTNKIWLSFMSMLLLFVSLFLAFFFGSLSIYSTLCFVFVFLVQWITWVFSLFGSGFPWAKVLPSFTGFFFGLLEPVPYGTNLPSFTGFSLIY